MWSSDGLKALGLFALSVIMMTAMCVGCRPTPVPPTTVRPLPATEADAAALQVLQATAICTSSAAATAEGAPTAAFTGGRPTSTPSAQATRRPRTDAPALASVATETATPTASATASRSSTSTWTPSPMPTLGTPTSTPTPIVPGRVWPSPDVTQASQRDWLARPFAPDAQQWAVPTYLFGSTANGQLRVHHGVDIPNPEGTEILAVAPGTVVFAGDDAATLVGPALDFYGLTIIVQLDQRYHDRPLYVLYGHLSAFRVQMGDHVETGQPVGEVGMTGIAMGPHLHLELRLGENSYQSTRNPELWLRALPNHGTIAGRLVNAEGRTLPGASVLFYRAESPELWRVVPVYADESGIEPDEEWGENFALADVPAGAYRVSSRVDGRVVSQSLVVEAGRTAFVMLSGASDVP